MKTAPGTVPCSYSSSSRTSRKVASSRRASASAGSTSWIFCLVLASRSRKPGIGILSARASDGPLCSKCYPGGRVFPSARRAARRPPAANAANSLVESHEGMERAVAQQVLGIDIGGTGIKGAPVDVQRGTLTADRYRLLTPKPAVPAPVADVVAQVVGKFGGEGTVGATFPAVVRGGVAETAANVDRSWIGEDVAKRLGQASGRSFVVLNDADAAGLAEMRFGAGRDKQGVVMMVTLGTGIGSALFVDGALVPNTELGHLELRGKEAEKRASEIVRENKKLTWKKWGARVDEYLRHVEMLFSPDLFVIGGGISKKATKFFGYLKTRAPIVPAQLLNEAGIVGAAVAAVEAGNAKTDAVKPARRAPAKRSPAARG